MWRRCGQRFQRVGRGRRSLSLWTRIAIFLKCSCGVTLSSSSWEILWSPENELFRSYAWGVLEPFSHVFFYVYVLFSWFKVSDSLTLNHCNARFCWQQKPFRIFHFSNKFEDQIKILWVFSLKIECEFYSLSSNNHHSKNSPYKLKM